MKGTLNKRGNASWQKVSYSLNFSILQACLLYYPGSSKRLAIALGLSGGVLLPRIFKETWRQLCVSAEESPISASAVPYAGVQTNKTPVTSTDVPVSLDRFDWSVNKVQAEIRWQQSVRGAIYSPATVTIKGTGGRITFPSLPREYLYDSGSTRPSSTGLWGKRQRPSVIRA